MSEPDNQARADACNRDGAALAGAGRFDAALACFDAALALRPDHVKALGNRASVLQLLGRLEEAVRDSDRALALDADRWETLYNRGLILSALGRLAEALACFERVVALRPDRADAAFNAGLTHLTLGDYAAGWRLHERRWETGQLPPPPRFPQPAWRGEADTTGKTILLFAEQGFGDTLQFCRFAPALAERARVILLVPSPLRRLVASLSDRVHVVDETQRLPDFDLQCPLLSLPLAFGTTLDTIPAAVPYLHVDPALTARWRQRLAGVRGRRIGLAWAGRSGSGRIDLRMRDQRRSISLPRFAPLAAVPDAIFVSLQIGEIAAAPPGLALHDWTRELTDFAETAALVAELDMVITVDTAVAHLAGALNKPVWILNRFDACWRWLRDRSDSPWYPSARLFRQPTPGDWDSVIADVAMALRDFIHDHPSVR